MKTPPCRFLALTFGLIMIAFIVCSCGEDPDIKRAKQFMDRGDSTKAIESLQKAIQDNPKNPEGHYLFGSILYDRVTDIRGIRGAVIKEFRACLQNTKDEKYVVKIGQKPIINQQMRTQRLTSPPGYCLDAVYSPDGKSIYYVLDPESISGYSPSNLCLYAMDHDGRNPELVFSTGCWNRPSISSDGNAIMTGKQYIDLKNQHSIELQDIGILWGTHDKPYISPDGKQFVLSIQFTNEDLTGLYLHNILSGNRTRITSGRDYNPCFLPDGKRVVFIGDYDFASSHGVGKTIAVVDIDGTNRKIIYQSPQNRGIWSLYPTKDGARIVFSERLAFGPGPKQCIIGIDGSGFKELERVLLPHLGGYFSDISMDNSTALFIDDNGQVCSFQMDFKKECTREELINALNTIDANKE